MEQAKEAFAQDEVPVGCIIVRKDDGVIVASTKNTMQQSKNPNAHAEMLAISEACRLMDSKNLSACDMYITLEPCTMCASAIANARIGRLYYAAPDEKQGAVENGVRFFTSNSCLHRPEIYTGMQREESINLMKSFFSKIRGDEV